MPNAITAVFGADSRPFRQEVDRASNYAEMWQRKTKANVGQALAQWRITGVAPDPMGLKAAAHDGFNLNGILRESLVIVREIGRGNWARVPGSISLLAQYLGVLKFVLNPVVLGLVAAGVALFYYVKHLKEAALEQRNFNEVFGETRKMYLDMAKALDDHHTQMMRAAEDAANFAEWQKKLADNTVSATDVIGEKIEVLRQEAEMQRQIARARGASQKQIDEMEQQQR